MRTKILSIVSLVFVLCCVCQSLAAQTLMGDVNSDGSITIVDAIILAQWVVGFSPAIDLKASDVDMSGFVSMVDALFIAKFADGIITEYPTVPPTPTPSATPIESPPPPTPTIDPDCSACPEVEVYGTVSDASGNPVAGANVSVSGKSMKTDSSGYYSLTDSGFCNEKYAHVTVDAMYFQTSESFAVLPACGSVRLDVKLVAAPRVQPAPGTVWLEPYEQVVVRTRQFATTCKIDTGTQKVAAYNIGIGYLKGALIPGTGDYNNVTYKGTGFATCVNVLSIGMDSIVGFDVAGKASNADSVFMTVYWIASLNGFSQFSINVKELTDETGTTIGTPQGAYSFVKVVNYGDVNTDGKVDIVDALLTAKYYIGLTPAGFFVDAADVNASGSADIVDALLIAQYYVGVITKFPAEP